ncbi:MAG TPA: HAMP domain-containing sensor histidine kinase [Trebonia sp.]
MTRGRGRGHRVPRPRGALRAASIRTRVMAAATLLVALTSLVTGFLGTTLLRSYLLDRSDSQLRNYATVVSGTLSRLHTAPGPGGPLQALPTQFLMRVIGADGKTELAGAPLQDTDGPSLSSAQLRDSGAPFTAPSAGAPGGPWRVIVRPLDGAQHLVVAYSLDDLNSTVTRLELADAIAGALALALLAVVGLPLIRASLEPLARIEATAAAIAGGDLSRRIDHPPGNTEVGRLAEALDAMLGTIEAAYRARADGEARAVRSEQRMRQFIADASHELRTPLTSVRGLAEYGLQQGTAATQDELLRLMTMIQNESARMGRLVADLLLLARLDAGPSLTRRPVDLASIAAEAVQAARVVHPGRPVTLVAAEPVVVRADDERVRQVIDNLLGNACTHTPEGSAVTVTVTATADSGQLSVADAGPGMTPQQAARVFERFYRSDDARDRNSGGTGLGLAIAASLTAAHGGQLTVDTAAGRGATFHVRLPLETADV